LILPVPILAAKVCGLGVIGRGEGAGAILQVIAAIARETVAALGVPSVAVRTHGLADAVCVEEGSIRAGKACARIPGLAERLGGGSEWGRVGNAISSSIFQ
jgi:hypothetical protein